MNLESAFFWKIEKFQANVLSKKTMGFSRETKLFLNREKEEVELKEHTALSSDKTYLLKKMLQRIVGIILTRNSKATLSVIMILSEHI